MMQWSAVSWLCLPTQRSCLCRYSSGILGEDSAAEDVDMLDAEPQVIAAHTDCMLCIPSQTTGITHSLLSMQQSCPLCGLILGCALQRGGKGRRGKGKAGNPRAEANRELERQQAEMEDATIRCLHKPHMMRRHRAHALPRSSSTNPQTPSCISHCCQGEGTVSTQTGNHRIAGHILLVKSEANQCATWQQEDCC